MDDRDQNKRDPMGREEETPTKKETSTIVVYLFTLLALVIVSIILKVIL